MRAYGFHFLGVILVTTIPFGIHNLGAAMDNVESAGAAGDAFPTTRVLTADGVISLIGCLIGNPFINAVTIGHPGGRAMGGRIGYSAATGVMVLLLTWFGVVAPMRALIPAVAMRRRRARRRHGRLSGRQRRPSQVSTVSSTESSAEISSVEPNGA